MPCDHFPNGDSLGLPTLNADGRRRVPGCRPGRCVGGVGGVLVVFRWGLGCLGGVSSVAVFGGVLVVFRRCPGRWWSSVWCFGVSVVSVVCTRQCLDNVSMSRWHPPYLGGVSVVSVVSQ